MRRKRNSNSIKKAKADRVGLSCPQMDGHRLCEDSFHLQSCESRDIWPMCRYLSVSSKHIWKSYRNLRPLFGNTSTMGVVPQTCFHRHTPLLPMENVPEYDIAMLYGVVAMLYGVVAWVWPHFPLPEKEVIVQRNIFQKIKMPSLFFQSLGFLKKKTQQLDFIRTRETHIDANHS